MSAPVIKLVGGPTALESTTTALEAFMGLLRQPPTLTGRSHVATAEIHSALHLVKRATFQ
jgi:hypothetical protein